MISINEFAGQICDQLNVPLPRIIRTTRGLATKSTLAALSPDGRELVLRPGVTGPDLFFSVSHELRHLWQMKYQPTMFTAYKPSDQMDLIQYNLQPAEIDANAYGALVMRDFGIVPLFLGLPEEVKAKIFEREEDIRNQRRIT